ncbi:MAG: hypothetical protein CVU87_11070 [Firmicutes bacterium HGW-Firmicutes-12]|jgi:glycosyltransferase involved in cell wall biosynthesis|nr:MAG: hypothetical protein CVU87_11070 [Firmicutes bacterium HGW-Firmicutes-12]
MIQKKITVGFDIRPLETHLKIKRGIGWSTLKIAKKLSSSNLPFNIIFYALGEQQLERYLPSASIIYIRSIEKLPEILRRDKINLFHINDYHFPLYNTHDFLRGNFLGIRTVISIYDLIPMLFYSQNDTAGKPPLEAMACGKPVISSDRGSLPEVLGDAALYINPEDINNIKEAIYNVATNATIKNSLIEKGLRKASEYTYSNTVNKLCKLYMNTLKLP